MTRVDINLALVAGRALADLTVEDDSPEGFRNLADAYTLFARGDKRDNPQQRGQFNFGEKLVLSICDEASIATTKGMVVFDPNEGRVEKPRQKRERGSVFQGRIKMTRREDFAGLRLSPVAFAPRRCCRMSQWRAARSP